MTGLDSNLLDPYSDIEEEYEDVLKSHALDAAVHYDISFYNPSSSWEDIIENLGNACGTIDDNFYIGEDLQDAVSLLENKEHMRFRSKDEDLYLLIGRASGVLIDKTVHPPEYLIGELKRRDSSDEEIPDWGFLGETRNPSFLEDPLERPNPY